MSSSTIRRTLREFEKRNWIRKEGYRYESTQLGTVIASGMEELIDRVEAERELREIWQWLPDEIGEFPVETWMAMTVTAAEPDSPYCPVNRFVSLLESTDELRFLRPEIALMDPCFDALFRLVEEGMRVTLIDRPSCHRYFLSTYPERSTELIERKNFTVLEHDELPPHGIGLLDDRIVVSCYEEGSGIVQALIDTDTPAVREWAESTYASFEREARPLASESLVAR